MFWKMMELGKGGLTCFAERRGEKCFALVWRRLFRCMPRGVQLQIGSGFCDLIRWPAFLQLLLYSSYDPDLFTAPNE